MQRQGGGAGAGAAGPKAGKPEWCRASLSVSSCPVVRTPKASGKYHRRQAAAAFQHDGVLRFQRIKDDEQLRAGRPVVPFAVKFEQVKQGIDGLIHLACRVQGKCEIKAGLAVGGVFFHGGAQIVFGTGFGGLAGQVDLATGGGPPSPSACAASISPKASWVRIRPV